MTETVNPPCPASCFGGHTRQNGAHDRNRTDDLTLTKGVLYHLSYMGDFANNSLERVMGVEPTLSAWKAEVLPLNYTRAFIPTRRWLMATACDPGEPAFQTIWWRGEDSNLRRLSRQIYSLIPLTAREPLQIKRRMIAPVSQPVNFSHVSLEPLEAPYSLASRHDGVSFNMSRSIFLPLRGRDWGRSGWM